MNQQRPYNSYTPAPRRNGKAESKKPVSIKHLGLIIFMLALVVAVFGVQNAQRAHARAAAAEQTAKHSSSVKAFNSRLAELSTRDPLVNFSVAIADSNYPQSSSYNAEIKSDAASTAKLLSASLFLKEVENGRYRLSQSIGGAPALSQLRLMVQQSDDTAWQQFNDLLGHKKLSSFADELGLSSYDSETNTISAADMNKLTRLLYSDNLLNRGHRQLLLSMMQHTNYEDFISPAVSKDFSLYHKVGINDDQVNDAAIIDNGYDVLFITIFSNGGGSYNWPHRAELMQSITRAAINAYLL